jgi:hypothetical protein
MPWRSRAPEPWRAGVPPETDHAGTPPPEVPEKLRVHTGDADVVPPAPRGIGVTQLVPPTKLVLIGPLNGLSGVRSSLWSRWMEPGVVGVPNERLARRCGVVV